MSCAVCDIMQVVASISPIARIQYIESRRIHPVDRVIPGVGVGLPCLQDVGVNGQELPRPRVVVAPY